jgi:hypothetical protein
LAARIRRILVEAARIGEAEGYDEINLNVGCPSDRVQSGRFGACLMREPELVAECMAAYRRGGEASRPTVKCRIGVDDQDPEEEPLPARRPLREGRRSPVRGPCEEGAPAGPVAEGEPRRPAAELSAGLPPEARASRT